MRNPIDTLFHTNRSGKITHAGNVLCKFCELLPMLRRGMMVTYYWDKYLYLCLLLTFLRLHRSPSYCCSHLPCLVHSSMTIPERAELSMNVTASNKFLTRKHILIWLALLNGRRSVHFPSFLSLFSFPSFQNFIRWSLCSDKHCSGTLARLNRPRQQKPG